MKEKEKQIKKIDQLISLLNDIILDVEDFPDDDKDDSLEFKIVLYLAEARNLLDEMKFEILDGHYYSTNKILK